MLFIYTRYVYASMLQHLTVSTVDSHIEEKKRIFIIVLYESRVCLCAFMMANRDKQMGWIYLILYTSIKERKVHITHSLTHTHTQSTVNKCACNWLIDWLLSNDEFYCLHVEQKFCVCICRALARMLARSLLCRCCRRRRWRCYQPAVHFLNDVSREITKYVLVIHIQWFPEYFKYCWDLLLRQPIPMNLLVAFFLNGKIGYSRVCVCMCRHKWFSFCYSKLSMGIQNATKSYWRSNVPWAWVHTHTRTHTAYEIDKWNTLTFVLWLSSCSMSMLISNNPVGVFHPIT